MIISLHVPKTGGATFTHLLRRHFGAKAAFFYGDRNPLTHPAAAEPVSRNGAELIERLRAEGIRIVRGHFPAKRFLKAVPDPACYWGWFREPVARVISNYLHLSNADDRATPRPNWREYADMGLEAYARLDEARNRQSRSLGRLKIEQMGFVGVTDRYDESIKVFGLPVEGAVTAVNVSKTSLDAP
ncbi:MAG: hypothetical protein ACXWVJ_06920, partial [Caulobacteraceae bacterium]